MKLLVISDNHGQYILVQDLIKKWRPEVDYIFHAGDSEIPADDPLWADVDGVVAGNMDFDPQFRPSMRVETPAGLVYLTHGHLEGVNRSTDTLIEKAKKAGARFVFYGHTHRLGSTYEDDLLCLNPGSLRSSRGEEPEATYALVDVGADSIQVTYYDLNNEKIDRLETTYKRSKN